MKSLFLMIAVVSAVLVGCSDPGSGATSPVPTPNPKETGKVLSVYGPLFGGYFVPGQSVQGMSQSGSHYQDQSNGNVHVICYPSPNTCYSTTLTTCTVNEGAPPFYDGSPYTIFERH